MGGPQGRGGVNHGIRPGIKLGTELGTRLGGRTSSKLAGKHQVANKRPTSVQASDSNQASN